ncbi:MAG: translocation/assembly module TamB domain-containing protein [Candidatus Acidiferrales bacterium]
MWFGKTIGRDKNDTERTKPAEHPKRLGRFRRFIGRAVVALAALVVVLALIAGILIWSGAADRWARGAVVSALEKRTGGRVELADIHIEWFHLRATLEDLTLHGKESAASPPLFHADRIVVGVRGDALLHRALELSALEIDRPSIHVLVAKDGSTNLPSPASKNPPSPWRQRLFELAISTIRLNNGEFFYNDARTPLEFRAEDFHLALDYATPSGQRIYIGDLEWKRAEFQERRLIPFPSDLTARFTLTEPGFHLTQLVLQLPHSSLDAQGDLESFAPPVLNFRYRGHLDLQDVRDVFHAPTAPTGLVDFSGQGNFAPPTTKSGRSTSQWSVAGHYDAEQIAISHLWFHERGISSRGDYQAGPAGLDVHDLEVAVLGGHFAGRLHMDYTGPRFRLDSTGGGVDYAETVKAVEHPGFPLAPLRWASTISVTSTATWTGGFRDLEARGVAQFTPPAAPGAVEIPMAARLDFDYVVEPQIVRIGPSQITTPTSTVALQGVIGKHGSNLNLTLDTTRLADWDDFINRLRGSDAEPEPIGGQVHWDGTITGPIGSPTFTGSVRAQQVRYGSLEWDEFAGAMTYSPSGFSMLHTVASRGRSTAQLDLTLALHNWTFEPSSAFTLDASVAGADTGDVQQIFGWSYPVQGTLTGEFHGRGTRADPQLTGLFDVTDLEGWGWRLTRARGEVAVHGSTVAISNAEFHLPAAAGAPASAPTGLLTGGFSYDTVNRTVSFDVTGAAIALDTIPRVQTPKLSVGGQLSFQLSGHGPLAAPTAEGTLRVVDLRLGGDTIGSFEGRVTGNGRTVALQVSSAMSTGHLDGQLEVTLAGDDPVQGQMTFSQIDLDPFLTAALHLNGLTGHSSADGHAAFAGFLAQPDTLSVEAELSRIDFHLESVDLENAGPIRINYRTGEVHIEQASLHGPDTDFSISGYARFGAGQALDLHIKGAVNLALVGGFWPQLEAGGRAQMDAAISGTLAAPLVRGNVRVADASANYGDFPAGLSHVNGNFIFDTTRLVLDNVTAQTGGGTAQITGAITYGDGPLRFDLAATSDQVRVRYPVGMSWLAGGTLRLVGDSNSAVLSGHVVVNRLLMSEGFDMASLVSSSSAPIGSPTTSSPFLRNLQFDLEADASPDARMQWSGANFQIDASLRVRGTWERPILLGHIHLLTGEMNFRGNQYKLTRGELNFSNPFRLDPVLNVEATTTIQQYEVTLDFTGPASRLQLSYRADPPLPSSDIISLLALGQTGEESGLRGTSGASTPQLGATTLLSEAISSQLGSRVERLFGVTSFRVDPFLGGPTSIQTSAARVTIEEQVTRNLAVTYISNVSSTQEQVIQIEYDINRSLSVVALRDENGTFGLDFIIRKRYK